MSSPVMSISSRVRLAAYGRFNGPDRATLRSGVSPAEASKSTPNGIRTRATAVKGRRPRPLDDGGLRRCARAHTSETLAGCRSGVPAPRRGCSHRHASFEGASHRALGRDPRRSDRVRRRRDRSHGRAAPRTADGPHVVGQRPATPARGVSLPTARSAARVAPGSRCGPGLTCPRADRRRTSQTCSRYSTCTTSPTCMPTGAAGCS